MGNDAYQLKGLNGVDQVLAGEEFSGRSQGVNIAEEWTGTIEMKRPDGTTFNLSLTDQPAGWFSGGLAVTVATASGIALVYPESTSYTIA